MRIIDLLRPESVMLRAPAAPKGEVLHRLVLLQAACGALDDPPRYEADVFARESQGSTAIGSGIAVPHAKSSAVLRPSLAAMTVPDGVSFGAPDGTPSTLFFMIAAPKEGGDVHLELLSRLMGLLMEPGFPQALLAAETGEDFLALIDAGERARFPEEPAPTLSPPVYQILAVTGCPTGIAHTYLAAEALTRAGESLGLSLKVETQGSAGVKNRLTADEIAACDGILVASDTSVGLGRFDGKPVLEVPVSDGIRRPEALLTMVSQGKAPLYHHPGGLPAADRSSAENFARQLYRHLMNGVSHMLPFVTGGGLLMALAFLVDASLVTPETYGLFGRITPLAAFFTGIGKLAFGLMLPVLSAYIAESIADKPGLVVGFVGGALAATGATLASFGQLRPAVVSAGFLGALLAGFAAGYLMVLLERLCDGLPPAVSGLKPVLLYPVVGIVLIGALVCALNPLIGLLNTALFSGLAAMGTMSKTILAFVVAGMMAVDMGGPISKAAYLFGTASLTGLAGYAVTSDLMAAVMAGGMVPPLAIALACTFFPSRFSPAQRKLGFSNYILGLCFITEGGVPFAAADPLRVIPACIAGSAVAGGLSLFWGCASPAPHGGIFIVPIMTHPFLFLLALCVGAAVGMLLLVLFKKRTEA
ncbi:MAG: fructose-specific PTS transporter subunit EIIC [Oscillospiraceae bacterium]